MAQTLLRGGDQIKNTTIPREDLVLDILGASDWDLSNGAKNATIKGLKDGVLDDSPATVKQLNDLAALVEASIVLRGTLVAPADMTGTATGNAYIDAGNGYSAGDKFFISGSGNITVSDGTLAVNSGDSITVQNDVGTNAAITLADLHKTDNTESPDIIRTGDVVDNLTSSGITTFPLSANQGFILKGLIDGLDALVNSRTYGEELTVTHNSPTLSATANTPIAGTLRVYLNGMRMLQGSGNDYTITGNVITMEYNLKNNDVVQVDYERL